MMKKLLFLLLVNCIVSLGNTKLPSLAIDPTPLPPGKRFLVRTNTGASTLNFNQDKRSAQPVTENTSFNRSNANTPSIQLKATSNNLTIDTNIKYFNHATPGLDPGYDVAGFGSNDFEIYTKLLEGHQDLNFTIQSLPTSNYENMIIPVGLKASSGDQITFAINALNFPSEINVYLEDREQNTFELLENDSQTYQITLSVDTNGIGRFYVHTTSSSNTWSGGATGDWNTGGNWSMGVPTTTSDITIPAGSVIASSSVVNVNTLTIPNNAGLNTTANVNNQGTITIHSVAANSGVLIAPSLNTNTVTYERGGFTANTWSLVSAPVSGQKIKDFVENPANGIRINTSVTPNRYAVAYYDDGRAIGSKWLYYDVDFLAANPNTEFEIGRSYSMSRATDGVVTFTGSTSTANVSKNVTASEWNAIGNPFTAFVSATSGTGGGTANFINDNLSNLDPTNAAVYVWDATQNRYLPRSLADTDPTSLPPGKGFLVRTNTGVSTLNFNQDKRSTQPATGNTSFNRNNANTPSIRLKATLNNLTIDTNIKYFDHATLGLNPGYDVAGFGGNDFELYTKLLDGHQDLNFTIQSLPNNNYENMVIPVGLKASAGDQITFAIDALHFPSGINIYLEDREQSTFELLETDSQTYQVTLSEDTNGIGRFYVHTTSSVLSTGNPLELKGVNVFTTDRRNLRITGVDNQQARVTLYNILGTQIFNNNFIGTGSNNIDLPYLKTGIYIINLETEKGRLNKKIVIK